MFNVNFQEIICFSSQRRTGISMNMMVYMSIPVSITACLFTVFIKCTVYTAVVYIARARPWRRKFELQSMNLPNFLETICFPPLNTVFSADENLWLKGRSLFVFPQAPFTIFDQRFIFHLDDRERNAFMAPSCSGLKGKMLELQTCKCSDIRSILIKYTIYYHHALF